MLTKRAHILFEPETWQLLGQVSDDLDISIGQAVRQAIKKTYIKQNTKLTTNQLLSDIKKLGSQINTKNINYKVLINHGRKY
ncbi:MAG: hypothetical protein ABIJ43_05645 [Candidatus Beckwithbacteria bacterium]|nr:hypothetical protein [Patescibacteria group bacterium]